MQRSGTIFYKFQAIGFIGILISFIVAAMSITGCSSSGGGGSRTEYSLTGYNGESSTSSNSIVTSASNAGLKFYAPAPWYVNVTYQVFDEKGNGFGNLLVSDFNVIEDGALVNQVASEMNIRMRTSLPPSFTYTMKTVLFLDNSPSQASDLTSILEGAQVVVDYIDENNQQEIALVAYDLDGDPVLIQDFTNDVSALTQYLTPGASTAIQPSYGTTNFYGGVKYALSLWEDNPSPANTALVQGFLVAMTDGNDTSGLFDVNDAIAARKNKQVVTVAIGQNIPQSSLDDLEKLGNFGFYPVPNPDIEPDEKTSDNPKDENLCEWMLVIQNKMLAFADGFYWLQYKSDKTSNGSNTNHVVEVSIINNGNENEDAFVKGTYSSSSFISGNAGVYFNANSADPSGVDEIEIMIERGQAFATENVSAITYARTGKEASEYTWTSSDTDIVTVAPQTGDTAIGVITVKKPGVVTLTAKDTPNNASAQLTIKVVERAFSFEIVQHEVESAPPWFVDATFQVRETDPINNQWNWITDMKREEFTVIENKGTANENMVDLEKSEIHIIKRNSMPSTQVYSLRTVLLIDNSPSVENDISNDLDLIKQAAKAFVYRAYVNNPYDNTDSGPILGANGENQQQIAIWSFNEFGDGMLVQDFTADVDTLNAAIDSIPQGQGPINFYGAMIDALSLWENDQSPDDENNLLQQGVLLVLSDGWDSLTGFQTKEAVMSQIKDKQVICVGVADDLATNANVKDLKDFGNDGYYSVPNPGETVTVNLTADSGDPPKTTKVTITILQQTLQHIQDEILDYANSFYWLNYKSYIYPAGNCLDTSSLFVTIDNNSNTNNSTNSISGEFETCEFFDGLPNEIYINSTATNPWGNDGPFEITYDSAGIFIKTASYNLTAMTYDPTDAPEFEWRSTNPNIVVVDVDENSYANSKASIRLPQNPHPGSATIEIEDIANNSFKNLTVNVKEIYIPIPILYYPFNGNANDASGNKNNGKVDGATLTADRFGNPNNAYQFTSYLSSRIAIGPFHYGTDETAFSDKVDKLSVCLWFKTSVNTGVQAFIDFDDSDYWGLFLTSGTVIFSNNIGSVRTTQTYSDNQWHQACVTYDADTGQVNIYVDGVLVKTQTQTGTIGIGSTRYGFVGAESEADTFDGKTANPAWFNGIIDDVSIFDTVLSVETIKELYNLK
jgi:hypothetical protein